MEENYNLPLIRHKSDSETVRRLAELGYPAIEPILPYILMWIQDGNWPVSRAVGPLLVSVGRPILPEIRRVISTNDDIWKFWCLELVISELPIEMIREFRPDLERIVDHPTEGEQQEEVVEVAARILARIEQHGA